MDLKEQGPTDTTAALALLTDAVKKGGAMASGSVGGMSGAFIPVSEDAGMIEAAHLGALSLDKLEAGPAYVPSYRHGSCARIHFGRDHCSDNCR